MNSQPEDTHDDNLDERPSKSQLKREMHNLKALGERMLELSPDQLAQLPISDRARDAIAEAHRLNHHREARRRHMQYVGKVLREEPIDALNQAVEGFEAGSDEHTRRHHLAERWRDRLMDAEDTHSLTEFLNHCPQADPQHLRNLIRNGARAKNDEQRKSHGRKLFRYVREQIDEHESPDLG